MILTLLIIIWLQVGLLGAITFIKKRNKLYKRTWTTKQVQDLSWMCFLGIFTWIVGFIMLYGAEKERYK